jgi:hypothetical protein|tara:strand:+ start:490 stop:687 length:198 start_codon:yes stop_codon:yes gene_type:complete
LKKKKVYSKHDLKREVQNTRIVVSMLSERFLNLEKVLQLYIEMNKHDKKFEKFLDAKSKEKEKED